MNKNKAIQMVFVDLDGTLLQGVDTVSPRTAEAFEKIRKAGITPVISTGRLAYEADFASRAIGADGYFIAINGLAVYEDYRTGKLLYEAYMETEAVTYIIGRLLRENVFFQAYASNRAYCQADRAHLIHTCGMDEAHAGFFEQKQCVVDNLQEYLIEKKLRVNKFLVSMQDTENIPFLRAWVNAVEGVKTLSSGAHFVEIIPEGADKQRAVRAVREAVGLNKSQVMVIGDSENDLGMFNEAFTCVAMANACPELKAKANYIAPSNYEDGVAWALEVLLLGEEGGIFSGNIQILRAEEIEEALHHSTRQYMAGNLKLPQQLPFFFDDNVEIGINSYSHFKWEQPHYHTVTSEYCYILSGETKYIDLSSREEHHFKAGDFYILRRDTPYIQKSPPGCRIFFAKAPGINDKVPVPMTESLERWCSAWEAPWEETQTPIRKTTAQEEEQ